MNLQAYANHRKALGLRGTSHVAVINAIKDERLTAPAVSREGRNWIINAELADEQWATRTDPNEYGGSSKPIGTKSSVNPASLTSVESDQSLKAQNSSKDALKNGPTLADAKRAREVYRAERERLKLMQEKGELVPAADVKREVMTLTRAIRDNMMSIPDRVASQLAATKDQHQCHQLLNSEIRTALRVLADG